MLTTKMIPKSKRLQELIADDIKQENPADIPFKAKQKIS